MIAIGTTVKAAASGMLPAVPCWRSTAWPMNRLGVDFGCHLVHHLESGLAGHGRWVKHDDVPAGNDGAVFGRPGVGGLLGCDGALIAGSDHDSHRDGECKGLCGMVHG